METDVLGDPYQRQTIDLGTDDEGPVEATLVRRRTDRPTGRAVLYVHGFNDYFFQTHLADFYVERGIDFYAIDLRKYGRSLLPHQTPNFIRRISDYFPELEVAARIIRDQDQHDRLLVNAHSTGGLITALWADQMQGHGLVDALFLNSPFFEININPIKRVLLAPVFGAVARFRPYARVPNEVSSAYGHSIHADHHGEWSFDPTWKPLLGFPPRAAWLTAIRKAQARLHRGLQIPVPVLVACSTRSEQLRSWSQEAHGADVVLDVEHIARWSASLGTHVTIVRIESGMHDLVLSPAPVRKRVFEELDRWLTAYLP
ncbi:MAG: alpha/beta hydrolase [Micromonosporaceae bacterium]|nr:alpha/beta hydrolase [Micromonosporaceae bacterium]